MIEILIYFILYILIVYSHEFGHYIPDYIFNLNPEIIYDKFYLPCRVDRDISGSILKDNIISISGIISGFIPLILYINYINKLPEILLIALFIGYIIGCLGDISNIIERI